MRARRFIAAAKWPALTALGTFAVVLILTGSFPYSVAGAWHDTPYFTEETRAPELNATPSVQNEWKTQSTRRQPMRNLEWQSPPLPRAIDRDCGDFKTRREAQRFFNAAGRGDPHRLDADRDGQACELLP